MSPPPPLLLLASVVFLCVVRALSRFRAWMVLIHKSTYLLLLFREVVLTFMEKPFIDFKFKLGKLNVMSIGPGDMNVGALVSETIKGIVTNLMVFPVKMVVPILEEQDILVSRRPPLCLCVFCVKRVYDIVCADSRQVLTFTKFLRFLLHTPPPPL